MLGLRFCGRAFSSCGERGPLFIAVRGPLTIAASLVAEHRLQTHRLSSCGSRAQPLRGMWDLPRSGLEPVSPALAGRLSTTALPGKPTLLYFNNSLWVSLRLPDGTFSCLSSLMSCALCLARGAGWLSIASVKNDPSSLRGEGGPSLARSWRQNVLELHVWQLFPSQPRGETASVSGAAQVFWELWDAETVLLRGQEVIRMEENFPNFQIFQISKFPNGRKLSKFQIWAWNTCVLTLTLGVALNQSPRPFESQFTHL